MRQSVERRNKTQSNMSNEIDEIVRKVCAKKGITKYTCEKLSGNKKGEGYLGEINFLTVTDDETGKQLPLVVKKSFTFEQLRSMMPLRDTFLNEIYFYADVWPKLDEVQQHLRPSERFNSVPELLAYSDVDLQEMLVMNNLKMLGFELYNKKIPVNAMHMKKIFLEYGKFHALSFVWQKNNNEEYLRVGGKLLNLFERFMSQDGFNLVIQSSAEKAMNALDEKEDAELVEYLQPFIDNGKELYFGQLEYKGEFSVVLHGDCWVNNQMFRYNENRELTDMNLIDFQLSRISTPVHDLAYCFYSGATPELLDQLEDYLKIYHDSLAKHYRKIIGESPKFTLEDLKADWLEYNNWGFLQGLMVWKMKATKQEDIVDMTDFKDTDLNNKDSVKEYLQIPFDTEFFNSIARPLVQHMHKLATIGW